MTPIIKVIVVDDEPTAREILLTHLEKIDIIQVLGSCKNATEAFSILNTEAIDLIFLDINMPEISGLLFAKAIHDTSNIIFTTAYRDYAVEGFELQAVDYLLKPISLERLIKAIHKFTASRVISTEEREYNFTFFRCDRKMVKINFDDLQYIESCGDYIKLHTSEKVLITRETMQIVSEKLPKQQFLRTHRSFIVAIPKIDSFTNEQLTIGRISIPISRSYRDMVSNRLNAIK